MACRWPSPMGQQSLLARTMEFHYTALSLLVPQRSLFRYRLDGFDKDWIDWKPQTGTTLGFAGRVHLSGDRKQ